VSEQQPEVVVVSPDGGYAPEFAVDVEGKPLDETTRNDVIQLRVTMDIQNMASFDVTFNNWDDRKLRFKYSEDEPGAEAFQLGRVVQIRLGYADKLVPVVTGQIADLRPSFPESGAPVIAISGTDKMQKLKVRKAREGEQRYFPKMADWQIAKRIAARNNLQVVASESGPVHPMVVQKNQDDASFLMERAKRIDFECYILTDFKSGKDTLHFERPRDGRLDDDAGGGGGPGQRARVYQLAYGPGLAAEEARGGGGGGAGPLVPNLIEFTPTLTASDQVTTLTVRGWNQRTKEPIAFTATASHLPGGTGAGSAAGRGLTGPRAAKAAFGDRQETVIDAPVASDEEARRLAIALLRERAYMFITGTGRIAGLAELRPSDNLEIHGIGRRFSGPYFVTHVEHTLGGGGFFTSFQVRRIEDRSKR